MINNVFLFTGEETYLLQQELKLWKEAFKKKHGGDFNLDVIDGAKAEIPQILSAMQAAPFLSEKRLLIIENLPAAPSARSAQALTKKDEAREEELEKLAGALETLPESSVVVFVSPSPDKRRSFYKSLLKVATLKEYKMLEGQKLIAWVSAKFQQAGVKATPALIENFLNLTGPDLWKITSELQKLSTYLQGASLTEEIMEKLVIPSAQTNVFGFTDALSAKNSKGAIDRLHNEMDAGENLHQTFSMVVRQFRILLLIAGYIQKHPGARASDMASALKLHPFVVEKTLPQVRRFSLEELKTAYQKLLTLDVELKTSQIKTTADNQNELALAIEKFILSLCSPTLAK
jgi:DNA polymerase-3 subunit delta